ncbi:MAG: nicotinamide-nucleotide amidohydrolase family protein [candidate division FCPU426 bacterium]
MGLGSAAAWLNWASGLAFPSPSLSRSDVVIACGGLGPTVDDITREAAAEVTACPLAEDLALKAVLTARFESRGRSMSPNNLRQAQRPQGAQVLENKNGTAPGLRISCQGVHQGKTLILLPGPPSELRPIFDEAVFPWLQDLLPPRDSDPGMVVHCWGLSESAVDQALRDLVPEGDSLSLALLAHGDFVEIRCTRHDLGSKVLERLGDHAFSSEGKSLEAVVGQLLSNAKATLCVAESCTGGRLAAKLTAEPGSSRFFMAGLVTYADGSKTDLLEVPPFVLKRSGAVSKDTALAMAVGLARRFGADYNLAVTGLAGPGGGSEEKPVGLVHFALAGPDGIATQEFRFGDAPRQQIQDRATNAGLFLLYRVLCGLPVPERDSDRAALSSR